MHQTIPTLAETEASLFPSPAPPAPVDPSTEAAINAESASEPVTEVAPEPFVQITTADYLGGIADLTGEMMRLAIASIGKSLVVPGAEKGTDGLPSIESIGKMVRDLKGGEFEPNVRLSIADSGASVRHAEQRWIPSRLTAAGSARK